MQQWVDINRYMDVSEDEIYVIYLQRYAHCRLGYEVSVLREGPPRIWRWSLKWIEVIEE
jgi:hypothetical protein